MTDPQLADLLRRADREIARLEALNHFAIANEIRAGGRQPPQFLINRIKWLAYRAKTGDFSTPPPKERRAGPAGAVWVTGGHHGNRRR